MICSCLFNGIIDFLYFYSTTEFLLEEHRKLFQGGMGGEGKGEVYVWCFMGGWLVFFFKRLIFVPV